jgi:hypothetical protein
MPMASAFQARSPRIQPPGAPRKNTRLPAGSARLRSRVMLESAKVPGVPQSPTGGTRKMSMVWASEACSPAVPRHTPPRFDCFRPPSRRGSRICANCRYLPHGHALPIVPSVDEGPSLPEKPVPMTDRRRVAKGPRDGESRRGGAIRQRKDDRETEQEKWDVAHGAAILRAPRFPTY